MKNAHKQLLVQTIRSAADGQVHLSARAAARLMREMRSPTNQLPLTDRERDVLREIGIGRTNREIARSLQIAETTVKSHVRAILDKLGVQSRTQAALQKVGADHHLSRMDRTLAPRRLSPRFDSRRHSRSLGREELLAAAAHELRLPLSHIKGFVSSLRRTDVTWDEDTRTEFLAEIELETDRLAQMLDSLLDGRRGSAAAAGAGGMACASPAAVIQGGLHRVRGLLRQRRIRHDVPTDLPALWMDASGIERVLANLLQNAIKYSPPGRPIGVSARVTSGAELEFSVEDEGPGIPPEIRALIFDPFYRNRTHLESNVPGHGLGLAICQQIVREHGGRMEVTDRPGGGARFSVFLPVRVQTGPFDNAYQTED